MKKIILLTVFVVIASAGSVFAQSRTMAVMPFDVVGNAVTADEAEALPELYISAVIETGRVRVIDRANFDKVMKELNFQTSDWSNSEKTAKLGKALNAKFISRGKIMKLGSNLSISSSVIDIETAENVASTKAIYKDIDELVARFFLEPSAWSYYDSGKLDDMLKDVADFYSGQGQAGGSIFYSDGNDFYEAVFLQGLVGFKEALELASGYYAGYNDWRLPTEDEVKYILHNVKGSKDKSFWLKDTYHGETYYVERTFETTGRKYREARSHTYACVKNGEVAHTAGKLLVCLVRKFKDE